MVTLTVGSSTIRKGFRWSKTMVVKVLSATLQTLSCKNQNQFSYYVCFDSEAGRMWCQPRLRNCYDVNSLYRTNHFEISSMTTIKTIHCNDMNLSFKWQSKSKAIHMKYEPSFNKIKVVHQAISISQESINFYDFFFFFYFCWYTKL